MVTVISILSLGPLPNTYVPASAVTFFTLPTYPRSEVVPTDTANLLWTQPEDSTIFQDYINDTPVTGTTLTPGKTLIEQTMFLNIAAPEVVIGASLLGLFVTINLARGFLTLLLAHVAFSIAYVAVTVRARMSGFDRSLEEAAADLGANSWVIFRKITFPLIMPGILAGALMAFALSIDDFVTSNFVSGAATPFPVWVYGATRIGIPPQVFVFGTAIFTVGILCAISSVIIGWRKPT